MKAERIWVALLLGVACIWGATFPIIKGATADIPPLQFVALRYGLASLLLIAVAAVWRRKVSGTTLGSGAILGTLLFGGYVLQTLGLVHTSSTNAAFLTGLSVIFVPVFGRLFFRVKLTRKIVAATGLATAGLWCLSGAGTIGLNLGDLMEIGCAVFFGLHILFVPRVGSRQDPLVLTAVQMATVAVLAAIASGFAEPRSTLPRGLDSWWALLFTGVLGSALAYLVQMKAQQKISPIKTALIFSTEPLWGAVFAYLLAAERISPMGYLGGVLLVIAMILMELPKRFPFRTTTRRASDRLRQEELHPGAPAHLDA
ncbi:DMT family transporter [Archangium lipolyticum]|uniref:DMT family transporter n=1 Tax=Archangium lipolyticum TaxID=2970465 RepID=UPI002149B958|nr:DMT family transporter [Archangium lipolyticum]